MLESKVTKLEHEQGTMSAQIRSELEGLFHDRIRALETTVTGAVQKHQQELERQQSHFGTLCGRLERCVPPRPARTPCRQRATAPLTKALVVFSGLADMQKEVKDELAEVVLTQQMQMLREDEGKQQQAEMLQLMRALVPAAPAPAPQ